jgi:CubicO group peptidase (beta-lactamase class C family)
MVAQALGGDVDTGFGKVADAFRRNFAARGEVGAAVAVYRDGQLVVDLWGGTRDTVSGSKWRAETMVPVFSTTKGVAAFVLGALHSRGLLDYDATVATYWPEFAQAGKAAITVGQLVAHQAGLPVLTEPMRVDALYDLDALAAVLARQQPLWTPGTRTAYHAITLGLYENELVRRLDSAGRTIGRIFAEDFAEPLGLRFHIGLPESVDVSDLAVLGRIGRRALPGQLRGVPWRLAVAAANRNSVLVKSLNNPVLGRPERFARAKVLGPEVASSNGFGDARSLARLYGLAAVGSTDFPVATSTLGLFARPVAAVRDAALQTLRAYAYGFSKPVPAWPFGSPGWNSYGTAGLGGSFGFADPHARKGFGYVTNRLGVALTDDPRERALREAVYRAL